MIVCRLYIDFLIDQVLRIRLLFFASVDFFFVQSVLNFSLFLTLFAVVAFLRVVGIKKKTKSCWCINKVSMMILPADDSLKCDDDSHDSEIISR